MPTPKFKFTREDYDNEKKRIEADEVLGDLMSIMIEPGQALAQDRATWVKITRDHERIKINGEHPSARLAAAPTANFNKKLGVDFTNLERNHIDFLSFFKQIEQKRAVLKKYPGSLLHEFDQRCDKSICEFYKENGKIFYKIILDSYPIQQSTELASEILKKIATDCPDLNLESEPDGTVFDSSTIGTIYKSNNQWYVLEPCTFIPGIEIAYELQGDQYVFQHIGSNSKRALDFFVRRTGVPDAYGFLLVGLNDDELSTEAFMQEFEGLLHEPNGLERALQILAFAFQQPSDRKDRVDEQELMKAIELKVKQQRVQVAKAASQAVDGGEEKNVAQKPQTTPQSTMLLDCSLPKIFDGLLDYQRNHPGTVYTIDDCAQYLVMGVDAVKSLGVSEGVIGKIMLDRLVGQPEREGDLCYFLQNAELGPILKKALTVEYLSQAADNFAQKIISPLAFIILQIELQRAEDVFFVLQLTEMISYPADASTKRTVNYFCTKHPDWITSEMLALALQRPVDQDGHANKVLEVIVCTIMNQAAGIEKIFSVLLSNAVADEKSEVNDQKINIKNLIRILDVFGENSTYRDQIIKHLVVNCNLSVVVDSKLTKIRRQLDNNKQLESAGLDLGSFLKMGENLEQYQVLANKLEDMFFKAYTKVLLVEHYLQRIQFGVLDANLDETNLDGAINVFRQLQIVLVLETFTNTPHKERLFLKERLECVSKQLFTAMQKEGRDDIPLYQKMVQKALVLLSKGADEAKLDDAASADPIRRDSRVISGGAATKIGFLANVKKIVGIATKPKAVDSAVEDPKTKPVVNNGQVPIL